MNENSPILIAAPPRSGTTLVAGLLSLHGVWVGEGEVTQSPETNSLIVTENEQIKRYLRKLGPNSIITTFRDNIISMVETDGPWLVKMGQVLLKWRLFHDAFPEAKWLLPRRSCSAIVSSALKHPGMRGGWAQRERIVKKFQEKQLDLAHSGATCHWIDMNRLAHKDEKEAKTFFSFCDVEFDPEIWNNFVDPGMWHER